MNTGFSVRAYTDTRFIGVHSYLHSNGPDHVIGSARTLFLPLRGTPGRVRHAPHELQRTRTSTASSDNTILIHAGNHVLGAQQAAVGAERCGCLVLRPHAGHKAACQPENGSMDGRRRRAMASRGRWS